MKLENVECQSVGIVLYENDSLNHLYSGQAALCNQHSSCKSTMKEIDSKSNLYNSFRHFKKRDVNMDSMLERGMYEASFADRSMSEANDNNFKEYLKRIEKIMLLGKLKTSNSIDVLTLDDSKIEAEQATFRMRLIRASNLTLGCIQACIGNFVGL